MWGKPKPIKTKLPPEAFKTFDTTKLPPMTAPSEQIISPSEDIKISIPEIEMYNLESGNITNAYMGLTTYYSTTLDIVTLYLKGQKLLYIESKTYCEMCLYYLMLPAIFISASCTVLSVALKNVSYGSVIVSALTAINSFILGIVTYLKLDAKSEAHKTSSYQFDKLQTRSEFFSGKIYMIPNEKIQSDVTSFFEDLEKKVTEIKDVNQFPLPENIRRKYAKIYGQNVFSDMKLHKTTRNKNVQRLIIIENLIKSFDHSKVRVGKPKVPQFDRQQSQHRFKFLPWNDEIDIKETTNDENLNDYTYEELVAEKEMILNKIIEYRNVSIEMNKIFDEQIARHIESNHKCCRCSWCCTYFCLKT